MIMWQELRPDDPGRMGPYRLRGQLGVGGMGRVFLGLSAGGRLVAVKVIRADLATDPEFRGAIPAGGCGRAQGEPPVHRAGD